MAINKQYFNNGNKWYLYFIGWTVMMGELSWGNYMERKTNFGL